MEAKSPFVESVGIPLQQMARVVVTNGEMTVEQEAFMKELLLLEQYGWSYSPCIVNPIKWSAELDNNYLEMHKK